jgi:hypothetical protein
MHIYLHYVEQALNVYLKKVHISKLPIMHITPLGVLVFPVVVILPTLTNNTL